MLWKISCFLHKNVNLFALQRKTFCRRKAHLFALRCTKNTEQNFATTKVFAWENTLLFFTLKRQFVLHFNAKLLPKKRQLVCTSTHKKNTAHNKLQQHIIARGNKTNFCRESKQTVRRKTTAGSCVKRNVSFCPFFCENSEKTVYITATLNFF